MLDAVGEAVIATDPDGRIIYWNDAATRLYGWRPEDVIGASILDVTPAAADQAAAILERLSAGNSWSGEFMVRHRDGRTFPVLVTDTAVRDADGRVVAIVGVSRDISRRRAFEEAASEAQDRVELVGHAAATAIREWELGTGSIRWSRSTGDAFGYLPDEIEPTWEWWTSRVHPEDRARVAGGLRAVVETDGTLWTDEYRFLTGDRGYATVFDRAHIARGEDGVAQRIVGTMVDVTERRRLHEGQRFLAQSSMILDLSMDVEATLPTIARLTVHALADWCLIQVSPGDGFAGFTTGAHIDPRLQTSVEEVGSFLSAGPPVGSALERVLRTGESLLMPTVTPEAFQYPATDDRLRQVTGALSPRSAILAPLRARRSVVGVAVFCRTRHDRPYDRTDLRLAEDLGRRIGLAVDNARLFQSAQLANRAKADFLAVISHELRTPLTAVLGYADLLEAEISGSLNQTQRRQVARIRAGSDRLLRLIEGILTFARLEAGGEKPQLEIVSLPDLIQRAEELIAPRAAEKGVGFRSTLHAVPDRIRTDPDCFVQIILSLLSNAVKFTHEGAVELDVRRENGRLVLDIRDNGSGIAPEHLPYIFNPFWQAEQPATRRAGGAGIGLSVARRLARLLKGDVVVAESTPKGTTLRFHLPLDPRP